MRFVKPKDVRIQLVDVSRRALDQLIATGKPGPDGKTRIPATAADLDAARARVQRAEDDGDWIDVKEELNAGEQKEIFTNLVKRQIAGEQAEIETRLIGMTKLLAYIIRWSAVDEGRPVPITESALNNLDVDTYQDLIEAVEAHEEAQEKIRQEKKSAIRIGVPA